MKKIACLLLTILSVFQLMHADEQTKVFEVSNLDTTRSTFTPYLTKRTLHGFLSGLLTHTFFYSQYRDILLDLDQHNLKELSENDYQVVHNQLADFPDFDLDECIERLDFPGKVPVEGRLVFQRKED